VAKTPSGTLRLKMIRRGAPERALRRRKARTLLPALGRRRPRPGFALGLSRVPRIDCSVSWLTDRHPIGAPRLRVLPRSLLRAAADLNGGAAQIIQGNKDIRAPPPQTGTRFVFMITQPTVAHVLLAEHDKVGAPHTGPEQQRHRQACLGAYRMAFLELPRPLPRLPS
jgi:hypothetical protein